MKNLLKSKIVARGYTNREIANLIGVHEQTISNWCNSRKIDNVLKFCELLNILQCDIKDIFVKEKEV